MSKINFFKKNKFLYWIYKIQKIYKNKKPNSHYAEFGEDIMVNRIFNNITNGFYIDIGAYHPYKGSLTYNLYKKGWTGANIDLSKTSIDLFNIARPKDININCAISNFSGDTHYFENSPINQQNSLISNQEGKNEIKIKSFTLDDLISLKNINKVDYINIDTEGNELEILNGINFNKISPYLFTIEENSFFPTNSSKLAKIKFMNGKGYELINIIGVTMFFVHKNSISKINDWISI